MKIKILSSFAAFFLAFSLQGQNILLNDTPTNFAESIEQATINETLQFRSGTLEEALDEAFDGVLEASEITGFNAAMMLPDGTIWKRAGGLATDDQFPQSLTTEHLMGMGSITKSFVSATILLMAEDEMLSLDDSIGMYLPEFPNISGGVTVRNILSHRTGFNDYLNENMNSLNAWASNIDSIWTLNSLMNNFVLEPNFAPDASWSYSNTNYLLAGLLIESIEGAPWYEVVRERIIDPLQLNNTFAHPFESYGGLPFAHAFSDLTGNGVFQDLQENGYPLEGFFSMATSAGNLITTPEDLVKFTTALHGGNLLSEASVDEMYVNYSPGVGIDYGLGVFKANIDNELFSWGHNGSIIYQSLAQHVPGKNVSIAVQQNDPRIDNGNQSYTDHTDVFLTLLDAFCNYETPVSTTIIQSSTIKVFPNPNDGQFVIENLANNGSVEIINSVGKIVATHSLSIGMNPINHKGILPKGVYFFRIGEEVQRIIIKQ